MIKRGQGDLYFKSARNRLATPAAAIEKKPQGLFPKGSSTKSGAMPFTEKQNCEAFPLLSLKTPRPSMPACVEAQ